ncbi:MAG: ATP-binding protein [Amylibacter sp.]|nr:ATP-binding protein [Amylibacter sp.]
MYRTGHLHLVCGLICAGKSTLCNALAAQPNTVLLSEDHWLKTLYGPEMQTVSDYVTYSKRLQNLLTSHVANLLQSGTTVVLDFPANTLKQRSWLMAVIEQANCQHTLHVLDVPIEDCKTRLFKRNAQRAHQFTVSEEQFDRFSAHFVAPSASEGFNIETHQP